jgi:D-amino-acid dehydrogenase
MRVVIVGGGVIGLATGYELARRGAEAVIVTDREPGAGASSNNAGWVVPAESGPVPAPGVILQTLRWMLRPDSPVYVRPELTPSFARFFVGMLRACTGAAYARAFDATAALARGTMDALDAWAADGMDFESHAEGELRAYVDQREYRKAVDDLARYERAGFAFEALSGDDARRAVPALGDGIVGAIRFGGQRHVRPQTVIDALVARVQAHGGSIVRRKVTRAAATATGVDVGGDGWSSNADAIVIAAGAWSAEVARLVGSRLPVRPGKGYSVDYVPAQLDMDPVVMLSEAHCAVTPLDGGMRVAGTMEFGRLDERISRARVRAIQAAPARYFRAWDPDAPHLVPSAGLRPMLPDGIACIGRLARHDRVYVATGHAMLGLTLAPRTATLLATMILDGLDPAELRPFSPARFGA